MSFNPIARRQKVYAAGGGDRFPVDRISNLPEALISHILSLLPTKSAVATSFLAKSWKLRWTKIAAFDFDDQLWPARESDPEMDFVSFVNMVFANHHEPIDKLRLRWQPDNVRPVHLNIWLNAAISRNIRILDLAAEIGEFQFKLPVALFTCASLEVLKLLGPFRVKLPHVVCLPKLTLLELIFVKFEVDESLEKLVSACPVLHFFKIRLRYCYNKLLVYKVSSRSLKRLEIYIEDPFSDSFKVLIDAPVLQHLVMHSDLISEISWTQDVTVNELDLDVAHPDFFRMIDGLVELIQGCCHCVTSMSLGFFTTEELANYKVSATFGRLTKLVASFSRLQWDFMLDLLGGCINLQVLDMTLEEEESEVLQFDRVPQCFSSSLKRVYFRSFRGSEYEMAVLKFILDHGLLIESVTLCSNVEVLSDKQELDILKRLSMLRRASTACTISFS